MNKIKNTHSKWISLSAAQILSLLMVFGIGGCKGCGGDPDTDTTIKLSMAVSPTSIVDDEKVTVMVKNEAEKISDDEPGHEVGLEKAKLMLKFLTQTGGTGTGSEFEYEDETGDLVKNSEVNKTLDKFKGNRNKVILAQETDSFEIKVVGGTGVTSAEFEITLVTINEDGAEEVVKTEKVTWTKTAAAELQLVDITNATDKTPGKFAFKVEKADIKPSEVHISWTTDHRTVFTFAGKKIGDKPTLKDLLGNDTIIKAGHKSAEIEYVLLTNTAAAKLATITLSLKKDKQELLAATANKLTWSAKGLELQLALAVDNAKKEITYTVDKKTGKTVKDADNIVLHYKKILATNTATLTKGGKGTETEAGKIKLLAVDFGTTDQVQDVITVNLNTEESVEVEVELFEDGLAVPGSKKSVTVKKDIQLSIDSIGYDRDDNKVLVKLTNGGTDEAKDVNLAYTTASTLATIGGKKEDAKKKIVIAASADLVVDLGALNLQTEKSAEFIFTLEHGVIKLGDKAHTFTAKNLTITLAVGDYDAEHGTVDVTVGNTGTDAVEKNDHLVLAYRLSNGAVLNGTSATSGSVDIDALAHTNGEFKKTLTIDLKDKESSTLTLELKLDGTDLGLGKTVECAEDVQLTSNFADTDLTGKADLKVEKVEYAVKNDGKNTATQGNLKVRLIRKKGTNSTINGVNPGSAVDNSEWIAATKDVAGEATENIVALILDPKDDKEVEIGVQLFYRGAEVGDVKTIIWKKLEPKLTITDLVEANLEGAEKTFKYKLENTGTGKAEKNQIKLKVTNKSAEGVTVAGEPIAHGASVELTYDKLGIVAEIAETNGKTGELNLTIDPQTNAKVSLGLEPMYDTAVQGVAQVVSWKADPVFASKIVMNGAETSFEEQLAKIIFTNKTGRELTVEDLKGLKLYYTAIDVEIYDKDGGINDQTLEVLGKATGVVKNNATIEIDIILKRADNTDKEITNVELKKGGNTVTKGPFAKLDWSASVLKFESKIAIIGGAMSFKAQPAKITLTNKSGRELAVEALKALRLYYTSADVEIHDKDGNIKGINLVDLAKITAPVGNDGVIELNVTLVREDNTKREITNIEVKAGTTVVMEGAFTQLDWEAAPKVTLSSVKADYDQVDTFMNLIVKSSVNISKELAKVIKVRFATENNESGELKLNNKTIQAMTLFDLLGHKGVDNTAGAIVKIDFNGFNNNITNFQISLEGPVEVDGMALTLAKKG